MLFKHTAEVGVDGGGRVVLLLAADSADALVDVSEVLATGGSHGHELVCEAVEQSRVVAVKRDRDQQVDRALQVAVTVVVVSADSDQLDEPVLNLDVELREVAVADVLEVPR